MAEKFRDPSVQSAPASTTTKPVASIPAPAQASAEPALPPPADPTAGLSKVDLEVVADMVFRRLQAAQAQAPTAVGGFDLERLGQVIGDSVAAGQARNLPPRKVTNGQYGLRNAWHPKGEKSLELERGCYQNGCMMREENMTNEEISLLNAITHSGRYLDRVIEVVIMPNGSEDEVHLRYNNKTFDQKMAFANAIKGGGLPYMLKTIVAAQVEERRIAELRGEDFSKTRLGRR